MEHEYERFLPIDDFYTTVEFYEQYGNSYQIFLKDSLIMKNEELFRTYQNDNLITIETQNGKKSISKNLLINLLNNDGMYKYLVYNMDNNLSIAVLINCFVDGKAIGSIKITRADISIFLKSLIPNLNSIQKMRVALITSLSSMVSCVKRYDNEIYQTIIDSEKYEINTKILLDILMMSDDEFASMAKKEEYLGFKTTHLAYMVVDFIERERILSKYVLTDEVCKRFYDIKSYQLIDFEALNKNQKANDNDYDGKSLIDKLVLDSYLESLIFNDLPNDYSPLEKSFQIYINMCEILTLNQEQLIKTKYNDYDNLARFARITEENNSVTSYDFVMIFAYFLKKLGISYTLNLTTIYENGIAGISYKYGEFIASCMPVQDEFNNDLSNVKIGLPIKGITCLNKNNITKNKFDELLYQVSTNKVKKKEEKQTFALLLEKYKKEYGEYQLDSKEKLLMLLKALCRKDLIGIDAINYERKIFTILFNNNKNISMNIIGSSVNKYKNFVLTPIMIISILTKSGYIYLVINPNEPDVINQVTKEELIELFNNEDYLYIKGESGSIPGIESVDNYVRKNTK